LGEGEARDVSAVILHCEKNLGVDVLGRAGDKGRCAD
jgi:hypothetical protein